MLAAYSWTARTGFALADRALAGCRRYARSGCQCVVVESGSSSVLTLPQSFLQRYAR
ncbi:MAG: hypothetical protein KIT16_05700 [Rhodospirillaceae bacterium]|nr:hypothetical protein [Rhodospirillaceae bacterium]